MSGMLHPDWLVCHENRHKRMVKRVYFLKKVNNVLDYLVMKIKAHTFALAIERDCFWLIG